MNTNLIRLIASIASVWLLCGELIAQPLSGNLKARFDQAVLDSAIRYEYLKPVALTLKLENDQLLKENLSLRILNELKDKKDAQDKEHYQAQLAGLRKNVKNLKIKSNQKETRNLLSG